jgi:hypothetical protein
VIKSETALKKGYFGKGKVNPKLIHRIGDYILIAKKNYCILDGNYRGKPSFMKGNHGGTSREEMIVPLIVVDSD